MNPKPSFNFDNFDIIRAVLKADGIPCWTSGDLPLVRIFKTIMGWRLECEIEARPQTGSVVVRVRFPRSVHGAAYGEVREFLDRAHSDHDFAFALIDPDSYTVKVVTGIYGDGALLDPQIIVNHLNAAFDKAARVFPLINAIDAGALTAREALDRFARDFIIEIIADASDDLDD